ncbi:hypothetical protein Pmani_022289 [Petrolisthes manimaculis]|uniref:RecQ mediated genome instability protein 1 OB-fold domain-containing protein n=1 Tax=Petrolisthes manimaculis TaxID=1843537 RepID=A0AAE1PEC5_9EUCA|nr:hypothetical protein Pmani_022289 [Petrolisthes manimaculis]
MRNVSAPKAFEESGGAPRMIKLSLTDGSNIIHGLELQQIKTISLRTAPGTKVRLQGRVILSGGFLMLNTNSLTILGGTVQELFDKWKLSVSVSKFSRLLRASDGSGPPPWVAFGKRISADHLPNPKDVHQFRALLRDPNANGAGGADAKDRQDDEFENQRKQVVKELAKEGNNKVFGGGKQLLDATVQKVVNAGFSPEVAVWALRNNRNDHARTIRELKAMASQRGRFEGATDFAGKGEY